MLRLDHPQPGYFTEEQANLVLTLASQAAIAVVNARLYVQAQRVAAVEERQRLARELHDSVAQTFYSIALAAHSVKAAVGVRPEVAERRVAHILELAEAGLAEMKALIFDLQAEGIRREGLVQALRRHADALSARNDVRVNVELGPEPDAGIEAKEALYGIAREALQNVVRHRARRNCGSGSAVQMKHYRSRLRTTARASHPISKGRGPWDCGRCRNGQRRQAATWKSGARRAEDRSFGRGFRWPRPDAPSARATARGIAAIGPGLTIVRGGPARVAGR